MLTDIVLPTGKPAGFPGCPHCPYMRAGPAWICLWCARRKLEDVTPDACPVCSQALPGNGRCRNWLCADPRRQIRRIDAITYLSGECREQILRYKYQGKSGWSLIFGRLVVGWLEGHAIDDRPDLIVANPTFRRPGDPPGHTEAVLASAAVADYEQRWPFDVRSGKLAVLKTGPTGRSAGGGAPAKRKLAAELRQLLRVPDPAMTEGRRILVFDDVCTTGSQLNAVAGCLLTDGRAAEVSGLVLARQPWRPS